MSKPTENREKKRREIERVAAHLFAKKGFQATSVRVLAKDLGMTQASLYYYFDNKEELLFKLMNNAMVDALASINDTWLSDVSAEEKLRRILGYYTRYYAGEQDQEILLLTEMNSLTPEHRAVLVEKQRHYLKIFYDILQKLKGQGKIKGDIHHSVATFAFLGMVHYTVRWYHPNGPVSLDQLSEMFVEIFTRGILST